MTDTGEHGRGGRRTPSKRTEPHALVRPYVLGTGSSSHRRPIQRGAGEQLTRGGQLAADWTGEPGQQPAGEARSDSAGRDAPTAPRAATARPPKVGSAGYHRAAGRSRGQAWWLGWPGLLAERRSFAVVGAAIAALTIVGGGIFFLAQAPTKRLANAPAPAHKAIGLSHSSATHSTVGHSPAPGEAHPTPHPTRSSPAPTSPRPTPTPTTSPTKTPVKVSYTVVRQHPHSFEGQFTIVNDGSTAISGWELVVVLPDDDIRSVSDASFHTDGDTLYIDPPGSQPSIAPGASVIENFTAHGSTTTLASCTFDGSSC